MNRAANKRFFHMALAVIVAFGTALVSPAITTAEDSLTVAQMNPPYENGDNSFSDELKCTDGTDEYDGNDGYDENNGNDGYDGDLQDANELTNGLTLSEGGLIPNSPAKSEFIETRVYAIDTYGNTVRSLIELTDENKDLQNAVAGKEYSQQLKCTGAAEAVNWEPDPMFPDAFKAYGLELSSNGIISGIPTKAGLIETHVYVEDDEGNVVAGGAIHLTIELGVFYETPLEGMVGKEFSHKLECIGTDNDVVWALDTDEHNPLTEYGLELSPDGIITGKPTKAGTFDLCVTVTEYDETGVSVVNKGSGVIEIIIVSMPLPNPTEKVATVTYSNNGHGKAGRLYNESANTHIENTVPNNHFTLSVTDIEDGYGFLYWKVEQQEFDGCVENPYKANSNFTVPNGDVTLKAIFVKTSAGTDFNLSDLAYKTIDN